MDIGIVPGEIGILPEYREVIGPPGRTIGPSGPYWRRGERATREGRALPFPKPNWTRGRGRPPSFLPPLSPFPFPPVEERKRGGGRILLGLGVQVEHPPGAPNLVGLLSPSLRYIHGQGHPNSTTDNLLAVCSAPSTVYHLSHIVIVLR